MDVTGFTDFIPPTRKLPHSIEAEMAFLGAILVDNRVYRDTRHVIRSDDFALTEHRSIFSACSKIIDAGNTADNITIRDESADDCGGKITNGYISALIDRAVAPVNARQYACLIREMADRRAVIEIANDLEERAYSIADDTPIAAVVAGISSKAESIVIQSWIQPTDAAVAMNQKIDPRNWLLGTVLCRGYVTLIAAAGGTGKTSLALAMGMSCATGNQIAGEYVKKRSRVLVLSLEDDSDEMSRRIKACAIYHGIDAADLKGWMWVQSLAGHDCRLLMTDDLKNRVETPLVSSLMSFIAQNKIDVLIIDPLVKASDGDENDNRAADRLAQVMVKIASRSGVAILGIHHMRKGQNVAGDIDGARGGGALKDAVRIGLTLTKMSEEEAEKFGVCGQDRWRYIRLDDGKANLAPANDKTRWYRLESVEIGNGTPDYPNGDNVQAVSTWSAPCTWDGIDAKVANAILDDIAAGPGDGELYAPGQGGTDRAVWCVVQEHASDKTEPQCREIIATWLASGILRIVNYRSKSQRKERKGISVDDSKRPS